MVKHELEYRVTIGHDESMGTDAMAHHDMLYNVRGFKPWPDNIQT